MQHSIDMNQISKIFGSQAGEMTKAIEACVHCGFCLVTCPTYQVMQEEMDSPRGRIVLMKTALEKNLTFEETTPYIDRCLGCLACVTACPSGVRYDELMFPFRNYARTKDQRPLAAKIQRKLIQRILPYPDRFYTAATLGKFAQPVSKVLPEEFRGMLDLLPPTVTKYQPLPSYVKNEGRRRARVALLAGCVQQILDQEINWATLRVLTKNGVEVVIPRGQGCCGAVLRHSGDDHGARLLAQQNLRAFTGDYDAILTNAAGCGSGLKEYKQLFRDMPEEGQVSRFVNKIKDVSVFLVELGLEIPPPWPSPVNVAYHDACHLAHAQGVTDAPRRILNAIQNVHLTPIPQAELCCGSAGTYNLEQPDLANEIGRLKVNNILNTGCDLVATGNIACMLQLQKHIHLRRKQIPVYHTMQILDMAYRQSADQQ